MGQAFDRDGQVLGEEYGETKREVFDKLTEQSVHDIPSGVSVGGGMPFGVAESPGEYNHPRVAVQRIDLNNVDHAFTFQPWNEDQTQRGREVTAALIVAAKAILRAVPECPMRTRAINCLFDSRMLANAAIAHEGRF